MASERVEWVEIIEPKTNERMYANLTTGECVWDPPVGVKVKKTDNNQWWELFDQKTSRFYYYNAASLKTVWHCPQNCDIIPLAKLQTIKQNTEPSTDEFEKNASENKKCKESVATQTPGRYSAAQSSTATNMRIPLTHISPTKTSNSEKNDSCVIDRIASIREAKSTETQTSPISPRRSHHHHHHHHHHSHNHRHDDHGKAWGTDVEDRPRRGSHHRAAYSQDSGRSSDSSCISLSRTSLDAKSAMSASTSTPLLKKKLLSDATIKENVVSRSIPHPIQRSSSSTSQHQLPSIKQKSFDIDISVGGGYSLGHENRSGSCSRANRQILLPSSASSHHLSRSHSFAMAAHPLSGAQSVDNDEQDDSMHEKYFQNASKLSVESTPQTRRKHHQVERSGPTEYANFITPPPPLHKAPSRSSRSSSNSSTLAPLSNSSCSRHPSLPSSHRSRDGGLSSNNEEENDEDDEDVRPEDDDDDGEEKDSSSSSVSELSSPTTAAITPRKSKLQASFNHQSGLRPRPSSNLSASSDSSKDKKPTYPLYSNVDYSTQNMLPLHQYILEQAKLSGCYKMGDSLAEEGDSVYSEEDEHDNARDEYESDEFADDEGMSNQEEDLSSSQEYLHDDSAHFLEQEFKLARPKNYSTDGRVSDYVVDELESRMAASGGSYYNIAHEPSRSNSHLGGQLPLQTQHASLKRKKEISQMPPPLYSPILERAESCRRSPSQSPLFRHSSLQRTDKSAAAQFEQLSRVVLNREKKLPSESDIEKYAQDNLNIHKKGIFRKKFSVRDMLSWSKDPIRKPMLVLSDKALKKEACELFKLVQIYMSDRKAKPEMTINSVAYDICNIGYTKAALRDELYIQICRQTTENPRKESLRRGWELLAICLAFFPPSPKFQAYLEGYMNRHRDPSLNFPEVGKWPIHVQVSHYATVSCKRLERGGVNGKRRPRKPSIEEIDQARIQIFRPSMFGSTLQEIMDMQKERFPHYKLPWIQTTLSEQVLRLQGTQTEGIFRVSADVDEVTSLKTQLDAWQVPVDCLTDAHTPASLLKLWYRELYEPLIPDAMYSECVTHHDNPSKALAIVDKLPLINKRVLMYLVRFLQMFTRPEVVQVTKMDASNLAMVIAPNCLRCTSQDPRTIFDNARKEMAFMRALIQHLDTSSVEGMF
ncbi:uncharacterized protein RhoGAP93B isoform X2 [Bemisia tabaci]|uniref:uncharacterized protein RhoGAP93B isoform X2 n=1 Tax=Bemisia tabaci TaxID=7038 RepID=UPI0008F9CA8E|nr:PREDICTED: rho GTPase-activating protein 39 isoform X2 [Bemisia tabaci]